MDCPRQRANVVVELSMDGKTLYQITTAPTGLNKDGTATVYRKLEVPSGRYSFHARLSDTADGASGYSKDLEVDLTPGQVLIVDFLPAKVVSSSVAAEVEPMRGLQTTIAAATSPSRACSIARVCS